jgi:1-phosphofructokinase family hexose kinase
VSLLFLAMSASVDRFLEVDRLEPGAIHRPQRVVEVPGGKALNAARAAQQLGADTHVVGLAGGFTGGWLREQVAAIGLRAEWVPTGAANRICTSVADATGQLTEFYDPTPGMADEEWRAFEARVDTAVRTSACRWLALSGSVPAGMDRARIASLTSAARTAGVGVAVDLSGAALADAMAGGVDIAKINVEEARDLLHSNEDAPALAGELLEGLHGDRPVAIVTAGGRGAVLATAQGCWRATTPPAGSWAVGSGDAFFGALLASLDREPDPVEALRSAVGAGAANTLEPGAARFDLDTQQRYRAQADVTRISCPSSA